MSVWANLLMDKLFQNAISVVTQVTRIPIVPTTIAICYLFNVAIVERNLMAVVPRNVKK
jgi:hypothetical protein